MADPRAATVLLINPSAIHSHTSEGSSAGINGNNKHANSPTKKHDMRSMVYRTVPPMAQAEDQSQDPIIDKYFNSKSFPAIAAGNQSYN